MSIISITDTSLNGKYLESKTQVPKKIRKYVKNNVFFAEYDVEVSNNLSILNIPLTAAMLSLAWVTGSDIYVEELDKTFKENIEHLQILFNKMYPKLPWTTKIQVDNLVENKIKTNR